MNVNCLFLAALAAGSAFALELPPEGTKDAKRPYEMVWANRRADEYAPVLPMTDAAGWTAVCRNASASVSTSDEHLLFGDGTVRLTYRGTGEKPEVDFSPAAPVGIRGPFDTVSLWVYGNNFYGKSPKGTPSTTLVARFADADGKAFEVQLGHIHHREWNKFQRRLGKDLEARVAKGAKFLGLTLKGGTNDEDRTLDFTSLCCFTPELKPLRFKDQPRRGVQVFADAPQGVNVGPGRLPFPNDARTVLPPKVEPDRGIEFRLPKRDGVWDDLAFRVDGGDWIPLAVGGGVWPRSEADRARTKFHRDGDSLVAEVTVKGGKAEELRFGGIDLPNEAEEIPQPFYTMGVHGNWQARPAVVATRVKGTPVFISATMDWTQSNASKPFPPTEDVTGLYAANGGARYVPKTDGTRNEVYERFVWTVSRDFAATLPTIPNDPSPWRHVTGRNAWIAHGASRDRQADRDAHFWKRRKGIRHLVVTDHETGWRDGDESFTFRTEPAPKKGGDRGQADYSRYMNEELGFIYGPYNNYTDLAPVNANWHTDHAQFGADGNLCESWARCYAPKPLFGLETCAAYIPVIQRKFNFRTAYCDVHTAVTPWSRTDYDARVPGAGTFAQTFYAYGQIMLLQKATWKGPVYSEGGNHWLYSGLTDGNYGQDRSYDLVKHPWLVDFDLLRMHPLTCDHMAYTSMFYGDGNVPKDRFEAMKWWFAAGLAFGHTPFLASEFQTYSYFMAQSVAAHYSQERVKAIRYADARGALLGTSAAVVSGDYRRSQVAVAYDGGTLVVVNGCREGDWMRVRRHDGALLLPPSGFFAIASDACCYSGPLGASERCDFAMGPEYVYVNGRGKPMECPGGATAGEFVRLREAGGTEEVIPANMGNGEEIALPYAARKLVGLDGRTSEPKGEVAFTVDARGWTRFKVTPNMYSYRVTLPDGYAYPPAADYEKAVLVPADAAIPPSPPRKVAESRPLPRQRKTGVVTADWTFEEIREGSGASVADGMRGCGAVTKHGICTHPPYQNGQTGAVYARYRLKVRPEDRRFLASVGKVNGSTRGDGIFFKVAVKTAADRRPKVLATVNVIEYEWKPVSVDLSPYAGQTVELYLISDPGANTYGDGGCWADPEISSSIPLPGEPCTKAALPPDPFPDRISAFVWRNWGLVPKGRLAETVKAKESDLTAIATDMGLEADPVVPPEWRRKGYITVLRRNWHLLPYDQLLTLLDMTREELRFSLVEDDFLFCKLGNLKPKCEPLLWKDGMRDEGRGKRRELVAILREEGLDPAAPEEPRFTFVRELSGSSAQALKRSDTSSSPFGFRLISSYFADYGDPLADPEVGSFPEGLLQKLAAEGVNAVWMHTVLRTLVKDAKYPEFGEGAENRIASLKRLIARAKRYGIRVYLYMNEPRGMPESFYAKNEERRGMRGVPAAEASGICAMCTSSPETLRWLHDSLRRLFASAPGLGGIFTITMSENLTHCASRWRKDRCPRCKDRPVADIVAEVNNAMVSGMLEGDPSAEALVWDWSWPREDGAVEAICAKLDKRGCRIMSVSENGMPFVRGGVKGTEGDYAISIVGPGESAKGLWGIAKANGIGRVAKVQANCSWELSSFPYLPVMDLVAEHAANLAREDVGGVMLSWSCGCCPAPNLRVFGEFRKGESDGSGVLGRLAEELYPGKADRARAAWTAFSKGFREYPFCVPTIYNGPQHWGVAAPVYAKATGYRATMVGIPYDDVKGWCGQYPAEVWAAQMQKVADGFAEGCRLMEGVADRRELGMFRAERMHFEECADQVRFVLARDAGRTDEVNAVLERMIARAKAYWPIVRADSRIGYESSNHYFFIPRDVLEKVLSCKVRAKAIL